MVALWIRNKVFFYFHLNSRPVQSLVSWFETLFLSAISLQCEVDSYCLLYVLQIVIWESYWPTKCFLRTVYPVLMFCDSHRMYMLLEWWRKCLCDESSKFSPIMKRKVCLYAFPGSGTNYKDSYIPQEDIVGYFPKRNIEVGFEIAVYSCSYFLLLTSSVVVVRFLLGFSFWDRCGYLNRGHPQIMNTFIHHVHLYQMLCVSTFFSNYMTVLGDNFFAFCRPSSIHSILNGNAELRQYMLEVYFTFVFSSIEIIENFTHNIWNFVWFHGLQLGMWNECITQKGDLKWETLFKLLQKSLGQRFRWFGLSGLIELFISIMLE